MANKFQITAALLCPAAAGKKLRILEAHNAAVNGNETAVITVFGSEHFDYCQFKSSLGTEESATAACSLFIQPMPHSPRVTH